MRFSLFFLVFLSTMGFFNYYSYQRFLKKAFYEARHLFLALSLVLMILETLFVLKLTTDLIKESAEVYYLLSSAIGISFCLFVIALFYDLNLFIFKNLPYQQERRRFIKLFFDVSMLFVSLGYLLQGLRGGLRFPIINTVDVTIKGFGTSPLVVIQLSDLHVGRTITKEFVQQLVDEVNAQKPDIVMLTGDIIDSDIERIKDDLAPISALQAPAYFILGNHEYFHGVEASMDIMKSLGVTVLFNENTQVHIKTHRFNLIGLGDLVGDRLKRYQMDIKKAYQNTDPSLPTIVLAHQPKSILRLQNRACDLMLSGHTHGGQIFPFGVLVMMAQPYLSGLHQHTQTQQIFVSRGAGYWGPPMRFLAPSEISKIIIKG